MLLTFGIEEGGVEVEIVTVAFRGPLGSHEIIILNPPIGPQRASCEARPMILRQLLRSASYVRYISGDHTFSGAPVRFLARAPAGRKKPLT
jgi:hypothetical protein